MKFNETFMNVISNNLSAGTIPMLLGEPGIGKSSWVIDLGKKLRTEVFVLPCNQLADKADLTGARLVPVTDKDGNVVDYEQNFYPHAVINQAIAYAIENPRETPILFLDEINRTTPDVTSEVLSIPTLRSIGKKKLPDNLKVIAAGNDKGNITSLDDASVSRFVLYHVEPDVATFLQINDNLNPFIAGVLQKYPNTIFSKPIRNEVASADDDADDDVDIDDIMLDDEMAQITTPRTITALSNWMNAYSSDQLKDMLADVNSQDINMLQEIVEGHVGHTLFSVYLMAEIAQNIMVVDNSSTTVNVAKPAIYDELKAVKDMGSLQTIVEDMSDNDKSGCMVYALYEKADNSIYIKELAPNVNKLLPEDSKTLMMLYSKDLLDEGNKDTFLALDCPLSQSFGVIMA